MPLSPEQTKQLRAIAADEGVNAERLIAVAEGVSNEPPAGARTDDQKLFMYLLPFVRVKEVRSRWLGLTDAFPGDDQVASDWATAHPMGGQDPNSGSQPT